MVTQLNYVSCIRAATDSVDREIHRFRLHWGRSLPFEAWVVVAPFSFLGFLSLEFLELPRSQEVLYLIF